MDVNTGYKYIERFKGVVQWYIMDSKDFVWSISFLLKNENGSLVSFIDQSIRFRIFIKKIQSF